MARSIRPILVSGVGEGEIGTQAHRSLVSNRNSVKFSTDGYLPLSLAIAAIV